MNKSGGCVKTLLSPYAWESVDIVGCVEEQEDCGMSSAYIILTFADKD